MSWLLRSETADELRALRGGLAFSAERRGAFEAWAAAAARRGAENVLSVSGDVARVKVEGLLTKNPSPMAWVFGYANTAYTDLQEALAIAASNRAVKSVTLEVDSPGGEVAGLFETFDALAGFQKPLTAICSQACSAAFGIVAHAGRIVAVTPASEFGSVGVAARLFVHDSIVDIASTNAPNKRPDVRTGEGVAMVRKELDAIEALFVEAIARGRKTTAAKVNADFGRGGVVLAVDARRAGMIDAINSQGRTRKATANPNTEPDLFLTQMFGGPELGESQVEYARRADDFILKATRIRKAGGTVHDVVRQLLGGDVESDGQRNGSLMDIFAADLGNKPDLGDQIVELMRHERGQGASPPKSNTDLLDLFASDNPQPDLGDRIVAEMQSRRGHRRTP